MVEIATLLQRSREAAGLTQKQLAERLGVHQSSVSRLEQGDGGTDQVDIARYLTAIGTEDALALAGVLEAPWNHLTAPAVNHPQANVLLRAERTLEQLDAFRRQDNVPQVLAGQAELLYRRLLESGQFLLRLDHRVTYVGEIGVGKTTAACRQAGLVLDGATASDLKGMLLDTGGGRTTLCEVAVHASDRYAIKVEPLADEEIYRLVGELCRAVSERKDGEGVQEQTPADFKPAEEVERALRNMAGLPRPPRRKGAPNPPDPATDLFASVTSLDEFKSEFAAKLTLWRRTRKFIEFDGADFGAGRQWLRSNFTMINNGRHADFSLPAHITITVPFALVPDTPFDIGLVDTRGVDGSAIRPDIVTQLKNRRALTLLCSKWGSAPDTYLQDLLKHVSETEVDPALRSRIGILVIARAGDALSMRHDGGDAAEDVADGYSIKQTHVEDALQRNSIQPVDVHVFDAAGDDPKDLMDFIVRKVEALRGAQVVSAEQTMSAVAHMLANVEEAIALAALNKVNEQFLLFADVNETLKEVRRPLHARLIEAVRNRVHQRTLWATTSRSGSFWNFDVYQYLGDGAAADAKRRAAPAVHFLRQFIELGLANKELTTAHDYLREVGKDIDAWEADFVCAARHHAVAVFKPVLFADADLWSRCEQIYGSGLPFKERVAGNLEDWFSTRLDLADEIERRIQKSWRSSVLQPLRTATGAPEIH
ncbi:MAG: helix-turn-helix transcriptional regulator [Terricaulis silvestris]